MNAITKNDTLRAGSVGEPAPAPGSAGISSRWQKVSASIQSAITISELLTKLFIAASVIGLFAVVALLPDSWAEPVLNRVQKRVDISIKDGKPELHLATRKADHTAAALASVQDAIQSAIDAAADGPVKTKLANAKSWVVEQRQLVDDKIAATTQGVQSVSRPPESQADVPAGWVYAGLAVDNKIVVPSTTVVIDSTLAKPSLTDIAAVNVRRPVALLSEVDSASGDIADLGKSESDNAFVIQPGGPPLKVLEKKTIPSIGSGVMVWTKVKPTRDWVTKTGKGAG